MRILHIINNLGSGGAEKLIEESLPIMNKAKEVETEVLLLTDRNNVFDSKLRENAIKMTILPRRKPGHPFNIVDIRSHIIAGKYDIVHAHLFPAHYWTSLAFKTLLTKKPKLFITEHNTHNRRREKFYFKYIDQFIYLSYDRRISISEKTQENLIAWIDPRGKHPDKFTVVENGINFRKCSEAEPYQKNQLHESFNENTKLLCMVGRFTKQKDHSTLIKAMNELPEEVHLLLAGEGPLKTDLQNLAAEYNVKDRVHFLGFRRDIENIFKTADMVILSSHWEGFGLVAAEGMAAGKPVITSDVPGLREVVKDAGLLFQKGNSRDLAEKVNFLFQHPEEYKSVSQACLLRAKNFSIESMVQKYMDSYTSLTNNKETKKHDIAKKNIRIGSLLTNKQERK